MVYLQAAGQQASQRSTLGEAVGHLTAALALLNTLPDTRQRLQQELHLPLALGVPLVFTKGHAAPEVEATYTRVLALCQQVGDASQQGLTPCTKPWRWQSIVGRVSGIPSGIGSRGSCC
jgi:predicted ATPase